MKRLKFEFVSKMLFLFFFPVFIWPLALWLLACLSTLLSNNNNNKKKLYYKKPKNNHWINIFKLR